MVPKDEPGEGRHWWACKTAQVPCNKLIARPRGGLEIMDSAMGLVCHSNQSRKEKAGDPSGHLHVMYWPRSGSNI